MTALIPSEWELDRSADTPMLNTSIRKAIERELDSAINPVGMHLNDGKARFSISHVDYMLKVIDRLETALTAERSKNAKLREEVLEEAAKKRPAQWVIGCVLFTNGKINDELAFLADVYGVHAVHLDGILEEFKRYLAEDAETPEGIEGKDGIISFVMKNFHFNEAELGEYGRITVPAHWEIEFEIDGIEVFPIAMKEKQ